MEPMTVELPTTHLGAELCRILRCNRCGNSLVKNSTASYQCVACKAQFLEVRGVRRFADPESYTNSFGWQWERYSKTQINDDESIRDAAFYRRTHIRPEELRGKLILDVGCGMGRFAEVATRWGGRVIGVDLSTACETAVRNLSGRDFVALQADVFALPFAPESFDVIYSIGVLHHTPDCETAFKCLPKLLNTGGTIAVWLYSGYNKWYRFTDLYRKLTCRLSPAILDRFFRVAVPILYHLDRGLRRIPIVGRVAAGAVHHVFPVSLNPDPQKRLLDTLDWYSPKYQSKHTYEQVFRWFESCGLKNLSVGDLTLAVRGQKPARSRTRLVLGSSSDGSSSDFARRVA